jgi:hypothetical protein
VVVVAVLLIGSLAMLTLGAGLVFIDQFEAGVVISPLTAGGVRSEPISPGIHFVTPFIESVERFATAKQEYTMSGTLTEGACRAMMQWRHVPRTGSSLHRRDGALYADPSKVVDLRRTWQGRIAIFKASCGHHSQCRLQCCLALQSRGNLRHQRAELQR